MGSEPAWESASRMVGRGYCKLRSCSEGEVASEGEQRSLPRTGLLCGRHLAQRANLHLGIGAYSS